MTTVNANPIAPVYPVVEVINCQIEGTNLRPGSVAGDDGSDWAVDRALRAAETAFTNNTPAHGAEVLNSHRENLAGRMVHHGQGVWVKFCPEPGCDAFVLNYGHQIHVHEMAQHQLAAHNTHSGAMLP